MFSPGSYLTNLFCFLDLLFTLLILLLLFPSIYFIFFLFYLCISYKQIPFLLLSSLSLSFLTHCIAFLFFPLFVFRLLPFLSFLVTSNLIKLFIDIQNATFVKLLFLHVSQKHIKQSNLDS